MNQEKAGNELFYDTYALYAIIKGEGSYGRFAKGYGIVTSLMNLYELYYTLLKEDENELAESFFSKLLGNCVEISSEAVKNAAIFRKRQVKRKLSYLDCLGYAIAREKGVKFLTGDEGFRDLANVKFVK
jgi:predicted nucleic acid-binding protein